MPRRIALLLLTLATAAAVQFVACAEPAAGNSTATPLANTYPVIGAPANDRDVVCVSTNPICGEDRPWWVRWDDSHLRDSVAYSWLPGLLTEHRFAEAVLLLSQWSEGKQLLQTAAKAGVRVVSAAPAAVGVTRTWEAYAAFAVDAHRPTVLINADYAETSTFEIADMLVHELTHAADWVAGRDTEDTFAACIAREQRARQAERRFLTYLVQRFGSLPTGQLAAQEVSDADQDLIGSLRHVAMVSDLDADTARDYQQICSTNP